MATIFVADDNPHVHAIVKETLSPMGHAVTGTTRSAGVLEEIAEARPHLLLLDSDSADADPYVRCRKIMEIPELDQTVTVVLASPLAVVDESSATEAGAATVLQKPLDPRALPTLVERLLRTVPAKPEALSVAALVDGVLADDEPDPDEVRRAIRRHVEDVMAASLPAIIDRITDSVATAIASR